MGAAKRMMERPDAAQKIGIEIDGIKAAFKEAGMDECAHCRSIMDKD